MPTVVCNASALAVATLFYYWRAHYQACAQQDTVLRKRIVYMLWVMASAMCL